MALDWQKNVDAWTNALYGSDYDWGTGWMDEWTAFKDWVEGSSPGTWEHTPVEGLQSPNRPMWEKGTTLTQEAFKALFDQWVAANPEEAVTDPGPAPEAPEMGVYTDWSKGYPEVWRVPLAYLQDGQLTAPLAEIPGAVLEKSYADQWAELQGLPGMYDFDPDTEGVQSGVEAWMQQQGYDFNDIGGYQSALDELVTLLMEGGEDDQSDAAEYAARQLGFESAQDFWDTKNQIGNVIFNEDPYSMARGFTEEERALRERYRANATRNLQQTEQQMLDNVLASSGSRTQYLRNMDESLGRIQDQQLQYDLAISQEEMERKDADLNRKQEMWSQMVQLGQMSESQFLQNVRADRALAAETISKQINAAIQQNQQYLNMYAADLSGINSYTNAVFEKINAEMGIDKTAMDMSAELYAQILAPWQTAMAEWDANMAMWEQKREEDMFYETLAAQTQGDPLSFLSDFFGPVIDIMSLVIGGGGLNFGTEASTSAGVPSEAYSGYTSSAGSANAIIDPNDPWIWNRYQDWNLP